jgi:small subunit ribosomal protein S21
MSKPKQFNGSRVDTREMPIHVALRKFKQKVDDSGVLEDLRNNMFFEKPTSVRKRKKGAARACWLKQLREQELPKKLY